MKIAIYARYSTENQNFKSTEDQINECKKYIEDNFPETTEIITFSDKAISGQYSHKRLNFLALKEAIRNKEIKIVVAEALDRIARSVGDTSDFYKLAQYNDISIWTIAEGEINTLHIGLQGTINEMYSSSVSRQVHRAQKARAKEGAMFGLPYGYKIKIKDGREVKGERDIDETQAQTVRMIFEMYAQGHSIPSICEVLNGHEIPSARGGLWTKHSILGSKQRKEGLLNNQIYIGNIVWNRRSLKTNPETGGVSYPVNDPETWVITHNEDLRIISDELWQQCEIKKVYKKGQKKKHPRVINPLRGLLFCSVCKGHKNLANSKRYVCANYRQYRTCTNARGMNYAMIIEKLFTYLREELIRQIDQGLTSNFFRIDTVKFDELEKISATIQILTNNIGDNDLDIPELTDRLAELHKERLALQNKAKKMISNEKNINQNLKISLDALEDSLQQEQKNDDSHIQLKTLLRSIVFTPTEKRTGEHMKILLHENCWQNFYQLAKS